MLFFTIGREHVYNLNTPYFIYLQHTKHEYDDIANNDNDDVSNAKNNDTNDDNIIITDNVNDDHNQIDNDN